MGSTPGTRPILPGRTRREEVASRLGEESDQVGPRVPAVPLLDQTNYRKLVDQLLSLLAALDCDVDLVVRARTA